MRKRNYPHWAFPSARAFRVSKRADLKALRKAFRDMCYGCAWTPVTKELDEIGRLLDVCHDVMREEYWKRGKRP